MKLYAYEHSVYSWIARIALAVSMRPCDYVEVDPFVEDPPAALRGLTPWQRVPVLTDGEFTLYETAAITSYINEQYCRSSLTPDTPRGRAVCRQIIGIIDHHGYWPMVRQVFSQRFYRPLTGDVVDQSILTEGLRASEKVLKAIEPLIGFLGVPRDRPLCLADIHLTPMMDYYLRSEPDSGGYQSIRGYPAIDRWWQAMSHYPQVVSTRPEFD